MLRWALITVALGLLLLVGGAALFVALNRGDAPAVDDADLRVERPVVPPEDNAYPILQGASARVRWKRANQKHLEELARDVHWDPCLARATVQENTEALLLLRRALRRPEFQTPPFPTIDSDLPNMLPWFALARVSAIRAVLRARSGNSEGAFADAAAGVRLGQLLQSDRGGTLIHGMSGVMLKKIGAEALSASVRHLTPSPVQSRRWTAALADLQTDREAWRSTWASEYQVMKPLVEHGNGDGAAEGVVLEDVSDADPSSWRGRILRSRYAFKPNATLRSYAEIIRAHRAHAGLPCSSFAKPPRLQTGQLAWLRLLGRPNGAGRSAVAGAAVDLARFEIHRCESDSQLAATEVLVALRAYQVTHGGLPESLDALVPEEIARIPESAMDGKPIRYSRSDRKLCIDDACGKDAVAIPF